MYNQPSQLLDTDADNKVVDADLALQVLGGDHVAFGHLTTTITVSDSDRAGVEDKVRRVERIINGLGFTTIREGVNAVGVAVVAARASLRERPAAPGPHAAPRAPHAAVVGLGGPGPQRPS